MPVTASKPGPYAPASAILSVVSRHRDGRMPPPITLDTLARAGISDSLVARTHQSLQTLDLIDKDGKPTQTFEGLRLAPGAEYVERLADWLRGAYAEIFAYVDPATADTANIRDAFRGYNPPGQQERMVSLFQGLCAAAHLGPQNPTAARATSTGSLPIRPRPGIHPALNRAAKPLIKPQPPKFSGKIPPPLAALLENLPQASNSWDAGSRKRFLAAFEAVLDLCIPVIDARDSDVDDKSAA